MTLRCLPGKEGLLVILGDKAKIKFPDGRAIMLENLFQVHRASAQYQIDMINKAVSAGDYSKAEVIYKNFTGEFSKKFPPFLEEHHFIYRYKDERGKDAYGVFHYNPPRQKEQPMPQNPVLALPEKPKSPFKQGLSPLEQMAMAAKLAKKQKK